MHTVEQWKTLLRSQLREALSARQSHIVAVLRETLAAIENAEAPPATTNTPTASTGTIFAGSNNGLRASEIPRLSLTPEATDAIIQREIQERREAVDQFTKLGRDKEASILTSQADLLDALAC